MIRSVEDAVDIGRVTRSQIKGGGFLAKHHGRKQLVKKLAVILGPIEDRIIISLGKCAVISGGGFFNR